MQVIFSLVFLCYTITLGYCNLDHSRKIDVNELTKYIPSLNKSDESDINIDLMITSGASAMKEKCLNKTNGDKIAYENIEKASHILTDCVKGLVNLTELQVEIEVSSSNGSLETVFNKYCRKRVVAFQCVQSFANVTEPCLDAEELEKKTLFMELFKTMLEFVCHKDGDHIAIFIANAGPECFKDRTDGIQDCGEKFSAKYTTEGHLGPTTITPIDCNDLDSLSECMVKELEECENTTPANLIDSMFKLIKKECVKQTNTEQTQASNLSSKAVLIKLSEIASAIFVTIVYLSRLK